LLVQANGSADANVNWLLRVKNTNVIRILLLLNGGTSNAFVDGTTTVNLNTWYYIAATCDGTGASANLKLWVNGNYEGGTTFNSSQVNTNTANTRVMAWPDVPTYTAGYASNVRILKGTALYTGTGPITVPTSPLTPISNTSLLTCQSNRFKDNSTANSGQPFTITVNGTPQVTPYFYPSGFTAPAASPGAVLLNGSSQFLKSTTATTAFQFGTNPYTVECWLYQPSRPARQYVCGGSFSGTGFQIFMDSGLLRCSATGIGDLPAATIAVPLNAWTHIAVVRTSTSAGGVAYYVNGVPAGTNTMSADISGTASYIDVGTSADSTTEPTIGYIANFRSVKGTAVYTGAFTPPSGPLTQTGGTYPSLTNVVTGFSAANTSLLLNLADSNYTSATNGVQNNTFIDSSNYAFPITRNGTPTQGSSTPYWPNGQWSNYFNGSTDYLSNATSGLITSAATYTVEGWIYLISNAADGGILATGDTSTSPVGFNIKISTGKLVWGEAWFTSFVTSSSSVPFNQWTHFACVKSSSSASGAKIYINGNLDVTGTLPNSTYGTSSFVVGRQYTGQNNTYLNAYLSNLRMVNGVAVYTGNFTPPTSPLQKTQSGNGGTIQAITGSQTSLLTCQSNRFIDNSNNNFTLTVNGSPTVQAFQPFSPTASYTTALYGGSGYFNGSTDYLTISNNTVIGTNSFTIEFWLYLTKSGQDQFVYGWRSGSDSSPIIYLNSPSNLVTFQSQVSIFMTSSTSVVPNTWTHIAIVRNGTGSNNLKMYFNGQEVASTTSSTNFSYSGTVNIGNGNGVTVYYGGYVSNFRVVNGVAVYTGAFTPPTLAPLATTGPASAASYSSTTNVNTTFLTPASLLLNMTNAGIYDAAAQNDVTTVGSAVTDTTTKQWSPSSTFLNGSANYLTMPANPQWAMSGDWTLEAWIYPTTVSGVQIIINTRNLSAVTSPVMYLNGSNLVIDTGAAPVISAGTISINSWQYVAATRSGNSWKLFIGGSQVGSTTTNTTSYSTAYGCAIGRSSAGENFNGYIQDVRVTKGVARTITASPSAAFPTR
jgi:hypothetical protein